jgi:hypothetical protein
MEEAIDQHMPCPGGAGWLDYPHHNQLIPNNPCHREFSHIGRFLT